MPTLTEIANQVNNTLTQINTNTQDTASTAGMIKGDTADIKNSLNTLNTNLMAGFVNLSSGIAVVIDQQKATNNLLDINRQQNDTIICWLANIADVLCRMLHRMNRQVELQTAMEDSLRQVRETLELVYGSETVEVLKRRELKARLDECCPPQEPRPEPCYELCRLPDYKPYDPKVPDYKPLQPDTQPRTGPK